MKGPKRIKVWKKRHAHLYHKPYSVMDLSAFLPIDKLYRVPLRIRFAWFFEAPIALAMTAPEHRQLSGSLPMPTNRNVDEAGENAQSDCAVLVFARAPIPGHAKKRLIPALGAPAAAALQQRMTEAVVQSAIAANIGKVTLFATPDLNHPSSLRWWRNTALLWRNSTERHWGSACRPRFAACCLPLAAAPRRC